MAPYPTVLPIPITTSKAPTPSCLTLPCNLPSNTSTQTSPPANITFGFVSQPDGRGSLGISWSCIFTLYACFWTILHLTVPGPKDSRSKIFFRKVKWLVITAVAPEYTYLVASGQREMAKKGLVSLHHEMAKKGFRSQDRWTMTHAFYADMGGFVLRVKNPAECFPVSITDIAYLMQKGLIDCQPPITRPEIKEKSKADSFAKVVACMQLAWLGLQCIARTAQHLPITQLELVTLVDAICALITYIAWFQKPYNLTAAAVCHYNVSKIADDDRRAFDKSFNYQFWIKDSAPPGSTRDRMPNAFPVALGRSLGADSSRATMSSGRGEEDDGMHGEEECEQDSHDEGAVNDHGYDRNEYDQDGQNEGGIEDKNNAIDDQRKSVDQGGEEDQASPSE
jgi:hypothetical protein